MSFLDFVPVVGDVIEGAFNAAEAQENRDWQANMSQSAHQREVDDLRAAGLNPVLSANHGAGFGSGAQASAPDISSSLTSSTLGRERLKADIEQIMSQIEQNKAQIEKTNAERDAVRQGIQINKPVEEFSNSTVAHIMPYIAGVLGIGGSVAGVAHGVKSISNARNNSANSLQWKKTPADMERALGKNGKSKAQNRAETAYKPSKNSRKKYGKPLSKEELFHKNFPEW